MELMERRKAQGNALFRLDLYKRATRKYEQVRYLYRERGSHVLNERDRLEPCGFVVLYVS